MERKTSNRHPVNSNSQTRPTPETGTVSHFLFGMAAMALILTASVLAQTFQFQGNCTLTGRKPKRVRLELLSYRTPQPGAARASYGGYTTA